MATEKTPAQKAAKFKELAEMRVTRALRAIDGISKLASKTKYAYTEKQVATIENAFKESLGACFAAFKAGNAPSGSGFTL
jgi:hypothetical protein